MLEGITYETQIALESMCHVGMCSFDVDDMFNLFESLAWYQWHNENAIESFVCPAPISYDLHTYFPLRCSYCQSFAMTRVLVPIMIFPTHASPKLLS